MSAHRIRRTVSGAALAAVALVISQGSAGPANADTDPGSPTAVVDPVHLLDPVIKVLPPLPVPYHPYTGSVCATGAASCIDDAVVEMQRRTSDLAARCDHRSVFSLAYLRVTENVRDALDHGYFADSVWLRQIDAVFADKYFTTLDAWRAGNKQAVPRAWQIALQAADDGSVTGLGDFMLGMNAHINRDFSYVLAEVGLTAADGTSHKPDHNAYNQRLDQLYVPVFAEEARRFDPHFDDIDVGPVDEDAAETIMRGWREMVWRNAEQLSLARTPAQRRLAVAVVENYATVQAQLIKTVFASGAGATASRDAWCATHHG